MRVLIAALTVLVAWSTPAGATSVTLNFDELAQGTILDTEYVGLGVTFSNSSGALIVSTATPGPPFTAPRAVLPQNYSTPGNFSQATFSVPVSFVSVVLGDFNQDADNLFLQLFDASNTLIGSDTDLLPAPVNGGLLLSASAPNIAYARFFGVGVDNNSVYFDNFTFETAQQAVPEPGTMLLVGSGIVAVARRRRKSS
jgi:hypothetical protein